MTETVFFDTLRQGLWTAVLMSAPILSVALLVGVAVGLFQALTSVQEMTLTFVPKLAALVVVFWASMSFMTQILVSYWTDHLVPVMAQGR